MIRYILVFLMVMSYCYLYSAEEKSINVSTAKNLYNSSFGNNSYPLNVKDNKYSTLLTPNTSWGFINDNYEGIVRLKINHANTIVYQKYTAEVTFEVKYEYFDNNVLTPASTSFNLKVTHDPLITMDEQIDLKEYHIANAFNVNVRITGIVFTDNSLQILPVNTPENLIVEAETSVERNYSFITTNVLNMGWNLNNQPFDLDNDGVKDELDILWSYIPGAEEYELEWTFINDYIGRDINNNILFLSPSSSLLKYNFINNSTKVRISENHYQIPLVFDHGYLVYRVRAVGLSLNGVDEEITGWTLADNTNPISNLIATNFYYNTGHELTKNWQYIATYAEEGKNKAVVNYMDNTFRSRQQVTKTNTNNQAIAGETIYDFQGRPAINVLPVPTGSEPIKFYSDFNLDLNNNVYSWKIFDQNDAAPCNVITPKMDTTSGASQYYSPANPDIAMQQGAIPDAKGYPFIQTEYEPDNTGKIRRQGGAGEEFQLLQNGHYTSYLYGQPSQNELDRLFGSEVGYKEHYQKNAVVDPNGQISVSYIDMYGKVIATSLAGKSPDSLIALESNKDPFPVNEELLATSNSVMLDSNRVEFTKDFIVTKDDTPYTYTYNLQKNQFNDCLDSLCYTCVYDLSISLINNACADRIDYTDVSGTIDSLCSGGGNGKSYTRTVSLDIGSYTLKKTLTLNQNAINTYASWFIDSLQTDCFNPVLPADPDSNGCCWTCDKCQNTLTDDSSTYRKKMQLEFPGWNADSIRSYYQTQVKLCKQMCNLPSDCEIAFKTMLMDVSPGGQYAQYKNSDGEIKPELFWVSVLNTSNYLPLNGVVPHTNNWQHPYSIYLDQYGDTAYINIDGDPTIASVNAVVVERLGGRYIRPEELKDVAEFVKYWQTSFAYSLVQYHPEYYYYLWCGRNDDAVGEYNSTPISSNEFDRILADAKDNTDTYNQFKNIGFLGDNSKTDEENLITLIAKDPFFISGGVGEEYICSGTYYYLKNPPVIKGKDLMLKLLESFKRIPNPNVNSKSSGIDIATIAFMTHNCPPAYYGNTNNCNILPDFNGINGRVNEGTFKTYFSYYLLCKKKVQEVLADCYSKSQSGFINQELPPFTMKPRGMFTPFYDDDDPSKDNSHFMSWLFGTDDYETSEYYNTFKNDMIYPSINPTKNNCAYNSNSCLKNFSWSSSVNHNSARYFDNLTISSSYLRVFPRMLLNSINPFFINKERRFPKLNDSYGTLKDKFGAEGDSDEELMADMLNKADINWFNTTGQCPLARDLQMFLNNVAFYETNGLIAANQIPISSGHFSKAFYDALLGSTMGMETCLWRGTESNGSLTGSITLGTAQKLNVMLNGLPSGVSWNQVKNISQLSALSSTTFNLNAKYIDAQSQFHDAFITGSFTNNSPVNIDIMGCSSLFDADCNTSDEVKTFKDVLTFMLKGHIFPNSSSPHFTSGYTTDAHDQPLTDLIINSKLKRYLYDQSAITTTSPTTILSYAVVKIQNSPTEFTYNFKIKNGNTAELIISLNTNTSLGDGYFFDVRHLGVTNDDFEIKFRKKASSNPAVYDAPVTYTGSVEYNVTYSTPSAIIPLDFDVGECAQTLDFTCRTPYHKNFSDLQKFIKNVVNAGKLTHNFNLFPGNYISDYLLSQFGGFYDLKWNSDIVNDTLFVHITGNNNQIVLCNLWFANNTLLTSPAYTNYSAFTNINGFILHPQFSASNLSNKFQFTTNGTPSLTLNGGSSCLDLSDCLPPCEPGSFTYDVVYKCEFDNNNDFTSDYTYKGTINTPGCLPMSQPPNSCYVEDEDYILTKYLSPPCDSVSGDVYEPINPNFGHFGAFFNESLVTGKALWEKQNIPVEIGTNYIFSFDFYNCARQQSSIFKVFINNIEQVIPINNDLYTNWRRITLPVWYSNNNTLVNIRIEYSNNPLSGASGYYIVTGLDNVTLSKGIPCGTPFNPFPAPPPFSPKDTCYKNMSNIAANNTYQLNKQILDSMRADFILKYKRKCLQTIETLYEETINPEYHYTLYYYDQAGLLLKTVPPEGVNPYTDANVLTEISSKRMQGIQSHFPIHRMATVYTYNSLNQLLNQTTPDGGYTRFWYDRLGRIILSQNAKQRAQSIDFFSYTFYDEIGRIIEVGEVKTVIGADTIKMMFDYDWFKDIVLQGIRSQITSTRYDSPMISNWTGLVYAFTPENLRNRVATVAVYEDQNKMLAFEYTHATHYSYDIHGNVKTIIQDFPTMSVYGTEQQYKRIDYKYDLISGKVNQVEYQKYGKDKFFHRYEYDADNRLTHVFTSADGIIWEKEAKYWYYKHGPLARTEIGDLEVQGMDYAYTLQGWVKGINSNILETANDLGRDANAGNILHAKFTPDAAAYSLNYFRDDYTPISNNFTNFTASIANLDQDLAQNAPGLYNGNISHMVTTIKDATGIAKPQLTAYRYDQLNRIMQMRAYNTIDIANNKWLTGTASDNYYAENYTYCANGNIQTLERYDNSGIKVDELTYNYEIDANYHLVNNRLLSVDDAIGSTAFTYDIDDQGENNYNYDAIGNMVYDKAEEIQEIKWSVYGKIKEILRATTSTRPNMEFIYDAMGNRVCKIVKPAASLADTNNWKYTYYVRDAQSNILTVYTQDNEKNGNTDLYLSEVELYGSSRIGLRQVDKKVSELLVPDTKYFYRTLGLKRYEISNHLGNVLTIFTDQKKEIPSGNIVGSYTAKIITSQDYYAFGMQMPARSFNGDKYRFGFNGQEKDQEIYNNQSTTTATFWEYDGRIARRWNVDPVVKSWQSTYVCFSGNPIARVDPNGDDDFFDLKGNFLGHTETEFNTIRIVNEGHTFESANENVVNNTKLLSSFNYLSNEKANRFMLSRIANIYAFQSIGNQVGFYEATKEGAAAHTNKISCEISLVINPETGLISTSHDISDQMISSLMHEKVHKGQGFELENYNPMLEIPAIMAQVNSSTFNKVTESFKKSMISYATLNINEALNKKLISKEGALNAIDMIMKSKLGDYGLIQYDEKSNQVNYQLNLATFETIDTKIVK